MGARPSTPRLPKKAVAVKALPPLSFSRWPRKCSAEPVARLNCLHNVGASLFRNARNDGAVNQRDVEPSRRGAMPSWQPIHETSMVRLTPPASGVTNRSIPPGPLSDGRGRGVGIIGIRAGLVEMRVHAAVAIHAPRLVHDELVDGRECPHRLQLRFERHRARAARACGAAVANSAAAATMRRGSRTRRLLRRSRAFGPLALLRGRQLDYALTSHHEGHERHHLLACCMRSPI